jgi:prepilin peptidase CpaA
MRALEASMLESAPSWAMIGLLCSTGVAAITDARTGLIPNWLTLPGLLGALLVHGLMGGPGAFGWAALSGFSCGMVPLVLFRARAIGGGDVKLFAVLGALVGVHSGLEVQMTSYGLAIAYALCCLIIRGQLRATLGRAVSVLKSLLLRNSANGACPDSGAGVPDPMLGLLYVRLGIPIFAASALLVVRQILGAWL